MDTKEYTKVLIYRMAESSNKTILKNTVFLYGRTLILLILGLYTSRVTMQALGVENYGIINVVSGFVSMFALISGALTGACQRFITFELGKKNGNVRQVFSSTFYIHTALAIIVVVLAETVGLYFVNHKLNLPHDKMVDALWVFHCSVISFVLNLINIPYNALIIAHEKMKAFAYISLIEAFFKFAIVYTILKLTFNPLILYAVLGLIASTIVRGIYQYYCVSSFKFEAKVERVKEKQSFKEIFGFAGWAFIGNSATLLNGQGINIILNVFVGVTINAARGIASMIEGTIMSFVYNFTTALNPQITKSYAQRDANRLSELLDLGTRMSFYLMIVMSVPVILVTPDLLKLWLTVYPDYSVSFIRITLFIAIVQTLSNPYITAICATGHIRNYQLVVGLITIVNVPVCYVLLMIGLDPIWVYISSLIMYIITFVIRILFIRSNVHIPVRILCLTILLRLFPISVLSFMVSYILSLNINTSTWFGLIEFAIISCVISLILIYIIGLRKPERKLVNCYITSKVRNKK